MDAWRHVLLDALVLCLNLANVSGAFRSLIPACTMIYE
jgi:hypothetical protein